MLASAVLWLTSVSLTVTLTYSWQCDCEYSGCVIHKIGAATYRSMDKILPGDNLVFSPIGLWSDMVYIMKAANGETKAVLLSFVTMEINNCKEENIPVYFESEFDVKDLFWPDTAPFWLLDVTYYRGSIINSKLPSRHITLQSDKDIHTAWTFNHQNDRLGHIRSKYSKNTFLYTDNFLQSGDLGDSSKTSFAKISYVKLHDKWRYPFQRTREYKHKSERFAMMQTSGMFFHGYEDKSGLRYIFLECEHRGISMVLVLPDSGKTLTDDNWDMLYPEDKEVKLLNVTIPKFYFEVEYSLIQVLRDYCGIVVTDQCDVSGINQIKQPVSQLIQKTVVRVDEKGLMFEGYTAVVSGTAPTREQPGGRQADYKPFYFYLFYDQYVIAQGRITNPSQLI